MAKGRPRTPAPTIAVTLWKAEYHHLAFLEEVMGSHSSSALSFPLTSLSPCSSIHSAMNWNCQSANHLIFCIHYKPSPSLSLTLSLSLYLSLQLRFNRLHFISLSSINISSLKLLSFMLDSGLPVYISLSFSLHFSLSFSLQLAIKYIHLYILQPS